MNIGEKIRSIRKSRGLSQAEVAERLAISIPAFSKIETGITDINLSRLDQIAELFEITTVQLATWDEEEIPPLELPGFVAAVRTIADREAEIMSLQSKVISLYDTLVKLRDDKR